MSRRNRHTLLSLHDVSPFHLERLNKAEDLFQALGVKRVAYLLIPNYHGIALANTPTFVEWCARERPFKVEWILHGFYHQEQTEDVSTSSSADSLKRKYATAGEGEFLALEYDRALERIHRGMTVFEETLGIRPAGFIPPAWLHHPDLPRALAATGFHFWENRTAVHSLSSDEQISAPVITWATRTRLRKSTSIMGTPVLEFALRAQPLVRLAVHPFDFDHPETVRSIETVWQRVLDRREQLSYSDLIGLG